MTELHDARRQAEEGATREPLTNLANRRAPRERFTDAQQRRARTSGGIGLVFVDLDGFKAINDTYGHAVGDRVLIEHGQQLIGATRNIDTVCRLGGDEFVILCPSVDGRSAAGPGCSACLDATDQRAADGRVGRAAGHAKHRIDHG